MSSPASHNQYTFAPHFVGSHGLASIVRLKIVPLILPSVQLQVELGRAETSSYISPLCCQRANLKKAPLATPVLKLLKINAGAIM